MHNLSLGERVEAFIKLGEKVGSISSVVLDKLVDTVQASNDWFDRASVLTALEGLVLYLRADSFKNWVGQYNVDVLQEVKKVGVIMSGNIPLAGLHDFICVLISGHILYAKLSEQDNKLLPFISRWLIEIAPGFKDYIHFVDSLIDIDRVIATGSNNSARYFDYYFSHLPHIIRRNRVACAIISGDESFTELEELSRDCLLYYGLGCRNVTKLFVPQAYNLDILLEALQTQGKIACQNYKYQHNYRYQKALHHVDGILHLDNNYIILTENVNLVSPISVLYYQRYNSVEYLKHQINNYREQLQCILSSKAWWEGSIPFGRAQFPQIHDYADGVDTLNFLLC